MQIRELVAKRTDLSTFVVHLTRNSEGVDANDKLINILESGTIEARSAFGQAKSRIVANSPAEASQKCVCFTETPLEYISLLTEEIDGRDCKFEPFGLALPKRLARKDSINPIWYIDITPGPGRDWLTNPLNRLIDQAVQTGQFENSDIAKIAPFIEQMGSQTGRYRKEFWWEREWRHVGDYHLPDRYIVIAPEEHFADLQAATIARGQAVGWIDPTWGLEEIIGRLAGFTSEDVSVMV